MTSNKKIRSVIIDDESSNRQLIRSMLTELTEDIEVLGEAENVASAYCLIDELRPDLIFLDIRMPDGTGFDLLGKFENMDFEVVFVSAFDNYALKAFEFSALDYVLKPIDSEKLQKTVHTVMKRLGVSSEHGRGVAEAMQLYEQNSMIISRVPVHAGNKVLLASLAEVMYIKAQDSYTHFVMKDGTIHVVARKFAEFDFILERHPNFIKIVKGLVVNINYIVSYTKDDPAEIFMTDGSSFEIARRRKKEILDLLLAAGRK